MDLCRERRLDPLALLDAYLRGGASLIQLRDKTSPGGARLDLASTMVRVAHGAGARIVVNDRADVARLAGADGVHVGQDDLSVEEVRAIVGSGAVVGVSTHDERQLEQALRTSASYIAVGPIYGTSSKDTGYSARGLELVQRAARTGRPIVAIGGITLERAPHVIAAGAASVAVISDLLVGDPEARTRAFVRALEGDGDSETG
ncbi:MAG: thiamine phosphate synthase [Vicinamibacterales bacterium]